MKVSLSSLVLVATLGIGVASSSSAHEEVAGNLKIEHPWIRVATVGASSTYGGVFEIKNDGGEPETLIGATVDGAGAGVLYQIIEKDGHSGSKVVTHGLLIKAHGSVELSPTTYQFKFTKITKPLSKDSTVNGTLVFEKMHSVPVQFLVEPGDTGPKEDAGPRQGDVHGDHPK